MFRTRLHTCVFGLYHWLTPNLLLYSWSTFFLFLGLFAVTACAETPRTGTNFCRQLAKEMPGISVMPATVEEVNAAVGHFTRLQKVAPLEVQQDWNALTELMIAASKVKADDAESVQQVADLAYATEANANTASEWVKATCGVDISLGVQVTP